MLFYVLMPWHLDGRERFLAWIAAGFLVLILAAKFQSGTPARTLSGVSPDVDKLQRLRASYVFVGAWFGQYWLHHLFLCAVALGAWWRIADRLEGFAQFLLALVPVLGLLSLLVAWITTDVLAWSLMPQLQPARAVLWTTFAAVVSSAMAACISETFGERVLWLTVPFAVTIQVQPLTLLWPSRFELLQHLAFVVLLAVVAAISIRWSAWAPGAVVVASMFVILYGAGVRNYPQIHSPDLDGLSAWARATTPIEAIFHFPDAGKELYPGIFRARAERAVWVDWKGGGQVNFMEPLAREWWRRWSALPAGTGAMFVRKAGRCGPAALFANAKYCVERPGPALNRSPGGPPPLTIPAPAHAARIASSHSARVFTVPRRFATPPVTWTFTCDASTSALRFSASSIPPGHPRPRPPPAPNSLHL